MTTTSKEELTLTTECEAYYQQGQTNSLLTNYLSKRGIIPAAIEEFRLGIISTPLSAEAENCKGRLTIPYLTTSGKVIACKARSLGADKPKYLNLRQDYPFPEQRVHLFNAKAALPSLSRRRVHLVEGELDAIICWQAGLKAVGVPGSTQWNPAWGWLFEAAQVVICYDGDSSGAAGAKAVSKHLAKYRVEHWIHPLPDGKDINDLWLDGGREAVVQAVGGGG